MTSIVLLGAALRVWAYASNTSLYLDEILLTRNILDLPVSHLLTQPLLLDQVSPRGFLLVERLALMIFDQGELALRLFPFVCAVVSVILFRRLAERTLTGAGPALSLLLFAIGVPFIRFGADVKPYEVDVAAAIGLLLLVLDRQEREASTKRLLLSRDRRTTRPLAITIPLWAAGCVVALLVGLRSMTPATCQFMHDFWAAGFLPLPLRLPAAFRWLGDRWASLFSDPTLLRYSWPEIFVVVALVGVVALWSRRRPVALLLPGEWTTGVCDENETRAYIKDVDRYRGVPRLWVLSGSGRPLRPVHAAVQSYLSSIGAKRDSVSLPSLTVGSVSIELYDLSDPTRLGATTADVFSVPPMPTDPRPGCREWTRPDFGTPSRSSPWQ
jgi:hypothetical protein